MRLAKILLLQAVLLACSAHSETFKPQYYEKAVESLPMPDILTSPSGVKIITAADWEKFARPEIVAILKREIYGTPLPRPSSVSFEASESCELFGGLGSFQTVRVTVADKAGSRGFSFGLSMPAKTAKPAPAFAGFHLTGPCDASAKILLERGFALMSFNADEAYPDSSAQNAFKSSVFSIFENAEKLRKKSSAIAAWAWTLSFALEYAVHDKRLDPERIFAAGHSRFGKTALVAAAFDTRFAGCIANNSGCMGAAPSRRMFGESVQTISKNFPHWFSPNFTKYASDTALLPIDQHQLLACIAPRPLYVASASEDQWSDPFGELSSLVEAGKIYRLYGADALPDAGNFSLDAPFFGNTGYHLRRGPHAMLEYDWTQFAEFAARQLKKTDSAER